MSSPAAAAMYPTLAAKERYEPKLRDRSESKGEWAKSNAPLWGDVRPTPNGLDRVPGLRRVNTKRG
jgi:hypothetical protein